jgi:hypothetical protein
MMLMISDLNDLICIMLHNNSFKCAGVHLDIFIIYMCIYMCVCIYIYIYEN